MKTTNPVILALWPLAATLAAATLESKGLRFTLSEETGVYEIVDQQGGVTWRSHPFEPRFGLVTLEVGGKRIETSLGRCQVDRTGAKLTATFHPLTNQPTAALRVQVAALREGRTLEWSWAADPGLPVVSVRLLDQALWVTDAEQGYAVIPCREGLLIPADSGLEFSRGFDTYAYEGCHMAMLGVVKNGAAVLATWQDPYVLAEVRSTLPKAGPVSARQVLSTSLMLRKSASTCRLQFLGRGDYVRIGQAYRQVAQERGWWVPWSRKLAGHPERAALFGAINYKLWSTLTRRMNDESTREEMSRVNWTFAEAAQVAEHLKRDLKLERVLFSMGGWIRRGYDNQHPDILPAAPECGGDQALADCAERVRKLGYVLALHDNYQDIYRDSPSWDENLIMKDRDGKLVKGGQWAGGRAYLTCSKKAVELAQRPNNLLAVLKLTRAPAYFIDTTYAAGLLECFDPQHPLTRWDDMKWKQAISDYARQLFGIFGSECGREWAIPHADFFEGLTGVSGGYYHDANLLKQVGGTSIPLFEMVFRDCIILHGKYGYDPEKASEYVLHHLSIGRPLNYHNIPAHLYWQKLESKGDPEDMAPAGGPAQAPGLFARADGGWAAGLHPLDRFVKNTYELLSPLHELTAQVPLTEHQFLTPDRRARRSVFGRGKQAVEVVVNASDTELVRASRLGGEVRLPPSGFLIEGPTFAAFCAESWNGLQYSRLACFTLRSLDAQPLAKSRRVRVFHAFGDARLRLGAREVRVERENLAELVRQEVRLTAPE